MNTLADSTRARRATSVATSPITRPHGVRTRARRLAGWWYADPMSASFAAARERDQLLYQRVARSR
jgi:hypothetical protein